MVLVSICVMPPKFAGQASRVLTLRGFLKLSARGCDCRLHNLIQRLNLGCLTCRWHASSACARWGWSASCAVYANRR